MKHLLTFFACLFAVSLSAQTEYPFPYNPDVDNDGYISVGDILEPLSIYGFEFSVDSANWVGSFLEQLNELSEENIELFEEMAALEGQLAYQDSVIIMLQDSATSVTQALEGFQLGLDSTISAAINAAQAQYLNSYCCFEPGNLAYVDEGCTVVLLQAVDYNGGGGTLHLTDEGRSEGDMLTVFLSARNGNVGTWLIEHNTSNGWVQLTSVNGWGGAGWLGCYPRWMRTFFFDGIDWQ